MVIPRGGRGGKHQGKDTAQDAEQLGTHDPGRDNQDHENLEPNAKRTASAKTVQDRGNGDMEMGTTPEEEEGSSSSVITSSDESWENMADQAQRFNTPPETRNTEVTGTGGDGDTVMETSPRENTANSSDTGSSEEERNRVGEDPEGGKDAALKGGGAVATDIRMENPIDMEEKRKKEEKDKKDAADKADREREETEKKRAQEERIIQEALQMKVRYKPADYDSANCGINFRGQLGDIPCFNPDDCKEEEIRTDKRIDLGEKHQEKAWIRDLLC